MKIFNNLTKLVRLSLVGVAAALFLTACDTMPSPAAHTSVAESGVIAQKTGSEHLLPVELGDAEDFAILSRTGITNVYESKIVGDVGTSPITGAALLLTCDEVTGNVYTVDVAGPSPCAEPAASLLNGAVAAMGTAYEDAVGRTDPVQTELGAGDITGEYLEPGLYKWATGLLITDDVYLVGGPDDVWIFQIAGTLTQANDAQVKLVGAKAKNVFWAVAGAVTIGTDALFQGTLLAKTSVAVQTNAKVNGRLLAQTAVTLQMNEVTHPAPPPEPETTTAPVLTTTPAVQDNRVVEAPDLDEAASFAILSGTGITNVYKSTIFGDVGTSPITGAALLLKCDEVVDGNVYTVDAAGPPCGLRKKMDPGHLTKVVGYMGAAYDKAAKPNELYSRDEDYNERGTAGAIGGLTLAPGVYKWTTGVSIPTSVKLAGSDTDVWIFQIAGTLTQANEARVELMGDAKPENIFWAVAGAVTIGTGAHFEGTLLAKTSVAVQTGATVNGRLLAQTAVTLQMNTVTKPTTD